MEILHRLTHSSGKTQLLRFFLIKQFKLDLIDYFAFPFALIQNPTEVLHSLTHSSGKTQFLRHLHTKIVLLEFDLIESFIRI